MAKDNVVQFPKGNPVNPIKVDNSGGIAREHMIFTDNLVEALVVNMIHNMAENGIDTDHPDFMRDIAFIVELIKSMIYREGGLDHPLQDFTKVFVEYLEEDGVTSLSIDLDMIKESLDEILDDKDEDE